MQIISLTILEKAALPPIQARAIIEVVDIEIDARSDVLASKADILAVKTDVLAVKADVFAIKADVLAIKADMAERLGKLETETALRLGDLKGELMRWVFLNSLTLVVILFGGMYFMLTHMLPVR